MKTLWIIHVPGTLAYQVCKDEEELSVPYVPLSEYEALQARVKDQAETLLVQKSIYETLCEKVNGLETQLTISWKKKADRLLIENARLREAIKKTISRADDYADSYITQPIRELNREKETCAVHKLETCDDC